MNSCLSCSPWFCQAWTDILSAISVALAPSEAKKAWQRTPSVLADRRSANSTAGRCVKPASMTCSSWFSCSVMAALMCGWPWPNRLTHQELMASRYRLPSKSSSQIPSARAIGTSGSDGWCFIWVQGCQTAVRLRCSQSSLRVMSVQGARLGGHGFRHFQMCQLAVGVGIHGGAAVVAILHREAMLVGHDVGHAQLS